MVSGVRVVRGLAFKCLVLGGLLFGMVAGPIASSSVAIAQSDSTIVVEGNRRVEAETIRSYFRRGPGGQFDAASVDEGLKALYATGLFQDVHIGHAERLSWSSP